MRSVLRLSPTAWRGLAAVASIVLVVGLLAVVLSRAAGGRQSSRTTLMRTLRAHDVKVG